MNFQDIPNEITDKVLELLNNHLSISASTLAKDKCILPMLVTQGNRPNSNNLMGLQPKNGQTDVDTALSVAINILKDSDFEYAWFSYSTQIGLSNGKLTNALKTYIFVKSGLRAINFETSKKIKGSY